MDTPRSLFPASDGLCNHDLGQAHNALKKAKRIYQAMVAVESILLREKEEDKLFQALCDTLLQTELFSSVGILMPNKAGRLRYRHIAGAGTDIVSGIQQAAAEEDSTLLLAEIAYQQGTTKISNDVNKDPRYAQAHGYMQMYLRAQVFLSVALLPVILDKKSYAVLSLCGRELDLFDVEMQDLGQRLVELISFALDNLRFRRQMQAEHARDAYLAYHDALTGLSNRPSILNRIPDAIARARRSKRLMAVCMMDLDDFKPVNDTYGHAMGDQVLQEIAGRLLAAVREIDTVARLGGDEFVLLLEDMECMDDLNQLMDRVSIAITTPITVSDNVIVQMDGSIGVTIYPLDDADPDILLRHADYALYELKNAKGRRLQRWKLYDAGSLTDTGQQHYKPLFLEGRLKVFYQPVLDSRTRKIVGIEALARLEDHNGHIVPPAEFLPEFSTDELTSLSYQVLQQALTDLHILDDHGSSLWVSFNVDPVSLSLGCMDCLRDAISHSGIDPHRVVMEILESGDFLSQSSAIDIIHGIKSQGVRITLDDVGSAYASLLRIKELPVDEIKLDQGFVRTLDQQPEHIQFVQSICDLAEGLGLDLVVEGVENDVILDMVTAIGAPFLQGYAISHPLPLEALQDFLQQPVTHRQHPVGLMGIYAAQISNYSILKKMMLRQPDLVDNRTIINADLCSVYGDLLRLGIAKDGLICTQYRIFHQAIAMIHALILAKSTVLDWEAVDCAHADFIRAIWEEHKLRSSMMES